jgi:hypothetical protein
VGKMAKAIECVARSRKRDREILQDFSLKNENKRIMGKL